MAEVTNFKVKASTHDNGQKSNVAKKKIKHSENSSTKKRKAIEDAVSIKPKKSRVPTKEEFSIKSQALTKKPSRDCAEPNRSTKESVMSSNTVVKKKGIQSQPIHEDSSEYSSEESEIDDQTDALIKGFQSDEDENDRQDESKDASHTKKYLQKESNQNLTKMLEQSTKIGPSEKPAVIYIGRIPHGFYENEMKSYFKQFGNILKLRLSRNKKTGASKHHAWIQFESAAVAEIVAKTMDNYLMFGHILKVKLVPEDRVPKDLFKGANKRFKKVPWNKIVGRKLQQPLPREAWLKRIEREKKRRTDKAIILKNLGYEFESPNIRSPGNTNQLQIEDPTSTVVS